MTQNIYIYILVMAVVTYLVRALPITLVQTKIKSQFLQSFLFYLPYVTLAVMTFPAILGATQSPVSGLIALVAGLVAAWLGAGLFPVATVCCGVVLLAEWIIL